MGEEVIAQLEDLTKSDSLSGKPQPCTIRNPRGADHMTNIQRDFLDEASRAAANDTPMQDGDMGLPHCSSGSENGSKSG